MTIAKRIQGVAAPPAGLDELQSAEVGRAFSKLLYLRFALFPIVVGVILWHWNLTGRSTGKLLVILAAYIVPALVYLVVLLRKRRLMEPRTLGFSVLGVIVLVISASALSGGLDSPFVILLPAVAATTAVGGDRRQVWISVLLQLAGIPLLAFVGGGRPVFTVGMLALGVGVGTTLGLTMRGMFERMLVRALQARDDLLRMHSEQLQALTSFSSEIAHELKTPLASIKGLTGLAMIELQDPARAAERLQVLRNEALRMQRLLDEFLDFSRPLSPLLLESADGLQIGEEVIELFQGLTRERHLALRMSGGPAEMRCDARKVKQVMINLVQNAVEASAPGGEVVVEVEAAADEVRMRVLDRGHGLSGEAARRVFEAGVTTKAKGSGLGLTIARAIAKQHGGSLTLVGREGGGCVAELIIPRTQTRAVLAA
jgi:two-component system, NtrC family, sensor histidine kinase HydH